MKKRFAILFLLFVLLPFSYSQNVSINESGSAPHQSAILDVSSSDKGMLVPRMSSLQREMISNKATGLLVFDTTTKGFWFYDGMTWVDLSSPTFIADRDGDTKIQVEEAGDEDVIRFDVLGSEIARMDQKTFHLNAPGNSVYVGELAGSFDEGTGGYNVGLGNDAMKFIQNGSFNTSLGSSAMQNNRAGSNNVAIGSAAGTNDTLSNKNVYIGARAGNLAFTPHSKEGSIMIGFEAGSQEMMSNKLYIENSNAVTPLIYGDFSSDSLVIHGSLGIKGNYTFPESDGTIGQVLSTDGNGNIGWSTKNIGVSKLEDADEDTKIELKEGVMDSINVQVDGKLGLSIVNNEGGYINFRKGVDAYNTLFGHRAGRHVGENSNFITGVDPSSGYNTAFGSNSMNFLQDGAFNTAFGSFALHSDTSGNVNTAVGYASLLELENGNANSALGSGSLRNMVIGGKNVAFGYQALLNQTEGSTNTALGAESGEFQILGDSSVYIGFEAGKGGDNEILDAHSKSGNVFIGHKAGKFEHSSNRLFIENSDSSTPLIYGEFDSDKVKIYGTLGIKDEYAFPDSDGNVGQVIKTNGTGILSWQDDEDGDPNNELISLIEFDGSQLEITDAGGVHAVDISTTQNEIIDNDGDTRVYFSEIPNDEISFDINSEKKLTMNEAADGSLNLEFFNTNTYIGRLAGVSSNEPATPMQNTFIGNAAGIANEKGFFNTYIGSSSGSKNRMGSRSVMVGNNAAFDDTLSTNSVYIGYRAGIGTTSGITEIHKKASNVMIGYNSGAGNKGSNNVFIGHESGKGFAGDHKLIIENSNSSTPLIYGEFDQDIVEINGTLRVSGLLRLKPSPIVLVCSTSDDEGLVYFDESAQKLRVCTSSGWVNLH
jgi:hypothetical protein